MESFLKNILQGHRMLLGLGKVDIVPQNNLKKFQLEKPETEWHQFRVKADDLHQKWGGGPFRKNLSFFTGCAVRIGSGCRIFDGTGAEGPVSVKDVVPRSDSNRRDPLVRIKDYQFFALWGEELMHLGQKAAHFALCPKITARKRKAAEDSGA
jgi:hypothetical protein